MGGTATLTLANIPLDLQITICIFLHPSDILALRKTCKALEVTTRRRVVWMAALRRVCIDNTLFLPSFPIPDMSDLELEQAAMAPRRWIELCGVFEKQDPNDPGAILYPRTTRIIKDATNSHLFIVPGGRYLVSAGIQGLFVWDLGYVSSADCKLIASVILEAVFEFCMVQATPDGMGFIVILPDTATHLSVFEIYPQNKTPLLTQIAHLDWYPSKEDPVHLLPDTLIFREISEDRIVFRVLDYRVNSSTRFSADVDIKGGGYIFETFVTKTAIIVFCQEEVLVWAIPPLLPQPSDFLGHFLDDNPTHIPPLFRIPFPDGIVRHTEIFEWKTISSWYFGSWESIYFDILYQDSKLDRFKMVVKPDLSDASLHVMNTSERTPYDLMDVFFQPYRMCEDKLVSCWRNIDDHKCGVYTGLTSASFANVTHFSRSLCPASGRFVYFAYDDEDSDDEDSDGRLVVVDLF